MLLGLYRMSAPSFSSANSQMLETAYNFFTLSASA
jgi:hypothetical protein